MAPVVAEYAWLYLDARAKLYVVDRGRHKVTNLLLVWRIRLQTTKS